MQEFFLFDKEYELVFQVFLMSWIAGMFYGIFLLNEEEPKKKKEVRVPHYTSSKKKKKL